MQFKRGKLGSLRFFQSTKKRGQLTIFIIIGIVIVVGIIGFYFIQGNEDLRSNDISQDPKIAFIRDNTLECFEEVYISSLMFIGFQGGYFNVTDGAFDGFEIPYYYKDERNLAPTILDIEKEIEKYINENIIKCIDYNRIIVSSDYFGLNLTKKDLLNYELSDYEISFTDPINKVKINKNEVLFITESNLVISDYAERQYILKLGEYPKLIKSNIFDMHEIASYISYSLYKNSEVLCISCVNDMVSEKDLIIDFVDFPIENVERIIIFSDESESPFLFQFLNKYKEVEYYGFEDFV